MGLDGSEWEWMGGGGSRWEWVGARFSITHFLLNLFSCLINSFIINDACKNLKENVNVKVKRKDKVVFRTLY